MTVQVPERIWVSRSGDMRFWSTRDHVSFADNPRQWTQKYVDAQIADERKELLDEAEALFRRALNQGWKASPELLAWFWKKESAK